jgi:hypothetical protein
VELEEERGVRVYVRGSKCRLSIPWWLANDIATACPEKFSRESVRLEPMSSTASQRPRRIIKPVSSPHL